MIDDVVTKVEFEVPTEERAQEIYDAICVGNEFVFNTVGPMPFVTYCHTMGKEEYIGEPLEELFYHWTTGLWTHDYRDCEIGELEWIGGTAAFKLYTYWGVPYPHILEFSDKFKVPFTLKHIEKTGRYWGIETFELDENERVRKTSERLSFGEDWRDLHIELIGVEPEEDEVPIPPSTTIITVRIGR